MSHGHGTTSTSPKDMVDPSALRFKMAVACDICRKRKVGCDGHRPCARCAKSGHECTFTTPRYVKRRVQRGDPSPSAPPRSPKRPRAILSGPTPSDTPFAGPSHAPATATLHGQAPAVTVTASGSGAGDANKDTGRQHLLLIDPDDQIMHQGPSSGMPLFARLGLLRTLEVTESQGPIAQFDSHSSAALGIASPSATDGDYLDLCLQRCPNALMSTLLGMFFRSPLRFPLLHSPSFLAEFIAVSQRRLPCTPQYGAMLMSILAYTVRVVDGAQAIVAGLPGISNGVGLYELALDLLRLSKNRLDIRHVLALYHLALYAEGQKASAGAFSGLISEAVGLAYATGLHRNTDAFSMDPVTAQIRIRLFWALYSLDIAIAYSQGRPPLLRLSDCNVDPPAQVSDERITKSKILPQPPGQPAMALSAAIVLNEIFWVLENVLVAINSPANGVHKHPHDGAVAAHSLSQTRLDEIETSLPPHLCENNYDATIDLVESPYWHSCHVRVTILFVRTLIARQHLVEELEDRLRGPVATQQACGFSVETIRIYARLRHLRLLRFWGFDAVSHLTAAGHTLVACMGRSSDIAFEQRSNLLAAVDLLRALSTRYPVAETAADLLGGLLRSLDGDLSMGMTSPESAAVRILARKTPRRRSTMLPPPGMLVQGPPPGVSASMGGSDAALTPNTAASLAELLGHPTAANGIAETWLSWGDSFSFLNDGLLGTGTLPMQ